MWYPNSNSKVSLEVNMLKSDRGAGIEPSMFLGGKPFVEALFQLIKFLQGRTPFHLHSQVFKHFPTSTDIRAE
jgi:hypothetical protein